MKSISMSLLALLLCTTSIAQSEVLTKLLDNPKKLYKYVKSVQPTNQIKNWQVRKGLCKDEDYTMPKRVGILTFYIQDKASYTYSVTGPVSTTHMSRATPDGVSYIANEIYVNCIDEMKKGYADMGMELLEPWEYITDPEQIDLYNEFQFESRKFMEKFNEKFASQDGHSAVAAGYRNFPLHHLGIQDMKFLNSRDEFLLNFNVDAFLLVSVTLSAEGDQLIDVKANIEYKNPATGTETAYRPFNESSWAHFKPEERIGEIFLKKEVEYVNKKGKTKTRQDKVGIDPQVGRVAAEMGIQSGRLIQNWLTDKK